MAIGNIANQTQLTLAERSSAAMPQPSVKNSTEAPTVEAPATTQLTADVSALDGALMSGNLTSTRHAFLTIQRDMIGPPPPPPSAFLNAASIAAMAAGILQEADPNATSGQSAGSTPKSDSSAAKHIDTSM